MKSFELTDDEYKTLQEIFYDHGSDCPSTCSEHYQALGEKLGILEAIAEPTEKELKRREEFRNSPYYKQLQEMFTNSNSLMSKMAADIMKDNAFTLGIQWGSKDFPIGTELKIRLPNDFNVIG